MFIKIFLLVLFFAVMLTVGFLCRRHAGSVSGFVLGGRNVGPWLTAFAYGTSYFSAVIFVGYAGQFGWKYGVSSTWIGIGNALIGSLLAWVILGGRTRAMTHHLQSSTMPEFFEKRFFSKALKITASVIIFVFLIPYTASLYNGLSRLFGMAFNIDYTWCVIGMAVLTGIYVIVGGYMATAVNDFIQGLIMLGGIVAVVIAVLNVKGGFVEAMAELSKFSVQTASGSTQFGAYTSLFGPAPLSLLGVVILTSLGTWGLPQMIGKFYAIKDTAAIRKGTIISTVFALIVAGGCYFLGGFVRWFSTEADLAAGGYDSLVPNMLNGMPDILIAVVVILVLSASMSTLSSLVLTSSSTITLDFIAPLFRKKIGERKQLLVMRLFIVFFIVISAAIAIVQAKSNVTFIAQLMGISWGALAGAFLAPFLYGLYFKKTTRAAVWVSFISGTGLMIANMICNFSGKVFINEYFTSPINAGMLVMVLELIIVPLVSLLTPKGDGKRIDDIFSCYTKENK